MQAHIAVGCGVDVPGAGGHLEPRRWLFEALLWRDRQERGVGQSSKVSHTRVSPNDLRCLCRELRAIAGVRDVSIRRVACRRVKCPQIQARPISTEPNSDCLRDSSPTSTRQREPPPSQPPSEGRRCRLTAQAATMTVAETIKDAVGLGGSGPSSECEVQFASLDVWALTCRSPSNEGRDV
jgi:hypothetical protein